MPPSRVRELAEQVASGHGLDILELSLRRQGRAQVLSVVLDADAPIDADVVEQISKELSRSLDADDPVPGSYLLEVTTPGLERPLQSGRDFRRQRGHEVQVVCAPGDGSRSELRGTVLDVDDDAVTLDVDGEKIRVPLSDVMRGKVVLPW